MNIHGAKYIRLYSRPVVQSSFLAKWLGETVRVRFRPYGRYSAPIVNLSPRTLSVLDCFSKQTMLGTENVCRSVYLVIIGSKMLL